VQKAASSKSFGLLLAAVFLVIAGLSYWSHGHAYAYWGISAAILLAVALLLPRVLAPLKRLWLKLGKLLHVIVSPLILSAVYLLVFIPVGATIRLFGKDPLSLKRDRMATSYWIERAGGPTPESLKDQF
jgi:saxitoxin biosynthesis operon SxtJ-like protein